jgi:hypothetical protein
MNPLQAKHLLIEVASNLIDSEPTGITLLLTDLYVARTSLDRPDAVPGSATLLARQRHARHAYDEGINLLSRLSLSERQRSRLERHLAILRERLVRLGEEL